MKLLILREPQHTLTGAYARHPLSPPNDSRIPFKTVGFSGLGYVLGVCWKILRLILLMEEILHQLICSLSHYIQGLYIRFFTFYHHFFHHLG